MAKILDDRSILEIAADPQAVELLKVCRSEVEQLGPSDDGRHYDTSSMHALSSLLRSGRTSRFQILHEELLPIIVSLSYSQAIEIDNLAVALAEALRDTLSPYFVGDSRFQFRSFSVVMKYPNGQSIWASAGVYFLNKRVCVEARDPKDVEAILAYARGARPKVAPESLGGNFEVQFIAFETTEAAFKESVKLFEPIMCAIVEMMDKTRVFDFGSFFELDETKREKRQAAQVEKSRQEVKLIRRLIELGMDGVDDGDTMKERLVRSLSLIVESYQSKPIPSAVLLFAAVEALVGDRRAGAARIDMITRNAAVLLQSDPTQRASAIAGIRRLHDARNAIVHGVDLELSERTHEEIRILAYALFRAVVQWMYHHDDITKEFHSEEEYFGCLRFAFDEGEAVPGVSPELAKFLPRTDLE